MNKSIWTSILSGTLNGLGIGIGSNIGFMNYSSAAIFFVLFLINLYLLYKIETDTSKYKNKSFVDKTV